MRHHARDANTIKGAWSLSKWQIVGIRHFVSARRISRYVAEATSHCFLLSTGKGIFAGALIAGATGRLTYKSTTA